MRRRSERKKSTDVSSPAPAKTRSERNRHKSHSISEDDKNVESSNELKKEKSIEEEAEQSNGDRERDSSEERLDSKRSGRRNSRMRTPVKEQRSSSSKRRNRRDTTPDNKINTIEEEENGNGNNSENEEKPNDGDGQQHKVESADKQTAHGKEDKDEEEQESPQKDNKNKGEKNDKNLNIEEKAKFEKSSYLAKTQEPEKNVQENQSNKSDKQNREEMNDDKSRSSVKSDKEETLDDKDQDQDEVKLHTRDNSPRSRSNSSDGKQPPTKGGNNNAEDDDEPEEGEVIDKADKSDDENNPRTEAKDRFLKRHSHEGSTRAKEDTKDHHKSEEVNHTQDGKTNESSNTTAAADTGRHTTTTNTTTTRKRRWITKKATESNREQILAISTDSLKTLIADVHPVPLSDVQLESSSEVEELASEREEGEQSPSPEPERRRDSIEKLDKSSKLLTTKSLKEINRQVNQVVLGVGAVPTSIQRSPSPARNQASNVLYITNLVRPFTVLQLKGLLARTGKIVENGFWIDRIKSKCYVQYETEDESIETRHALHGVRWPASNPKCLNVDFGMKNDMLKAIESTKEDAPKFGQETNKDNMVVGSGWSRERHDDDRKGSRPVREWDVGKKENLDRDKGNKDGDRRRERSRDRSRDRSRERNISRNRDNERSERGKDRRQRRERDVRSNSISPVRKQKKKEDPPLRLLDDLFRKTKATPCIYWLPLTPEQIADKEALRQKRLEEQKQRLKQRELEREKEREKDRNRQGDRDRDRDHRRSSNRSSDRRRSRSRDRRRY